MRTNNPPRLIYPDSPIPFLTLAIRIPTMDVSLTKNHQKSRMTPRTAIVEELCEVALLCVGTGVLSQMQN